METRQCGSAEESLGVCPFLTVPHKQTLKASIYLEYLFIFYMTRHKKLQLLKTLQKKKIYNSVSSSSSFQGTDMIGGAAPRSNRELVAART